MYVNNFGALRKGLHHRLHRLRYSHPLSRRRDLAFTSRPSPTCLQSGRIPQARVGRPRPHTQAGDRGIGGANPGGRLGRMEGPPDCRLLPFPGWAGARGPGAGRRREGSSGAGGRVPGPRSASERVHKCPGLSPRSPRGRSRPAPPTLPDPRGACRWRPRGPGRARGRAARASPPSGSRPCVASERRPDGATARSRGGRIPGKQDPADARSPRESSETRRSSPRHPPPETWNADSRGSAQGQDKFLVV